MKFKLYKSEHSKFFNFYKQIDKLKITMRENKMSNGDSLIFYPLNNSVNICTSNNIVSCNTDLEFSSDNFMPFAVDINIFCNAFNNFPVEEINFIFDSEENNLIFGNKKTKVSIKTSSLKDFERCESLNDSSEAQFNSLNNLNFYNCLKYVANSCSVELDEFPYNSIMFYIDDNQFSSITSDKHRITVFGNKYENQKSYLLTKSSSDLIMTFIKENDNFEYSIYKNKLIIKNKKSILSCPLSINNFQNVYFKINEFFDKSDIVLSTKIDKNNLLKSLKFISSISNSDSVDLNFDNKILALTNNKVDKSSVADKIELDSEVCSLDSTYLISHLIKILDLMPENNVQIKIINYNSYNLCCFESNNFKHVIFPMS